MPYPTDTVAVPIEVNIMPLTEGNADTRLRKHYDRLWNASSQGFKEYLKYPSRSLHTKRTRANIVHDEILAKAIGEFDEVPNVKLIDKPRMNLQLLKVGDDLLLWFKKMDAQRRCQLVLTEHAKLLQAGQIPMFPNADILVVGYLLNPEETRVDRVSIGKPAGVGKVPEWFIDLYANEKIIKFPKGSSAANILSKAPTSVSGRLRVIRSSQFRLG
jgi:hypothetical protein